jgi:hypothetical protein
MLLSDLPRNFGIRDQRRLIKIGDQEPELNQNLTEAAEGQGDPSDCSRFSGTASSAQMLAAELEWAKTRIALTPNMKISYLPMGIRTVAAALVARMTKIISLSPEVTF